MGTDTVSKRQQWSFDDECDDILLNKNTLAKGYIRYMLMQTLEMFEYDGLPETIPQKELELLLQMNSLAIWGKDSDGKLYVFYGGLGGELNEYYHPTIAVVSNPYLRLTVNWKIDEECVVMFNDKCRFGLRNMFTKYGLLLAETDITMRYLLVNARIPSFITADDDNTVESAKEVYEKVWNGTGFGTILNKKFMDKDGIRGVEFGNKNTSPIKDIMELRQYIKSSWYLELGIQSNYNMKRESLNSSETTMDEDVLLPLIDDMLRERQIGLEKVNKMFGLNVTVRLSSSWKKIREEIQNELDKQEDETQEEPKVDENVEKNKDENEQTDN